MILRHGAVPKHCRSRIRSRLDISYHRRIFDSQRSIESASVLVIMVKFQLNGPEVPVL